MRIHITLFFLFIVKVAYLQNINYKIGDTLTVFTTGGLKLRSAPSLAGNTIVLMKLGEKSMVVDLLKDSATIDGFQGNWVKLQYNGSTGYAFDGFLSALPLPTINLFQSIKNAEDDDVFELFVMETILTQYINTNFKTQNAPLEYYNGMGGENYLRLFLQSLTNGFTWITHQGWENSSTELVMPNVRLSEIKNLIILFAEQSGISANKIKCVKEQAKLLKPFNRSEEKICPLENFNMEVIDYQNNSGLQKWSLVFNTYT